MEADLVVLGGTVVTLGDPEEAEAVAVRGSEILEVGSRRRVEGFIGRSTRIFDADGLTIAPGLADGHAHLIATGLAAQVVDLFGLGSLKRTLEAMGKAAATKARGQWVVGRGFDDTMVVDRRYPTARELDEVVPNHPALVERADGHSCILNSLGLKTLRLRPPLEGMDLDGAGRPTGVLRHEANARAQERYGATLSVEAKRRAFLAACAQGLARGLTAVHDIEGEGRDVDLVLRTRRDTPLRVLLYSIAKDPATIPEGCRGLKVFVDGSMDSHTALLHEPYADNPSTRGVFYSEPEALERLVKGAVARGLQVMTHAIGDRAIEEILRVYARHPAPGGSPHRIEHYELPTAAYNQQCAREGVVVSTQPAFVHLWDYQGFYVARAGPARARGIHPYRTLEALGVVLCGGSDSPVTPLDPLLGIHGAVNHPLESERLTPRQALAMFTLGAARAVGEEAHRGTIAPGKAADLTVLDANPLEVQQEKLKVIGVVGTIVGGQVAYDRRAQGPPAKA